MASNLFDNKTPKNILLEACSKNRWFPRWDTVEIQKQPPVFRVVCQIDREAGNVTEEGHGATKKAAEQAVALKMLHHTFTVEELLKTTAAWKQIVGEENRVIKTIARRDTEADIADPVSDTDDNEISGEPIGELNTVCARSKLTVPKYEDSQVGPQNAAIFTVKVTVGSLISTLGRRRVKKDAKRIAAYRALRELKAKGYNSGDKKSKGQRSTSLETSTTATGEVTSSHDEDVEPAVKTVRNSNITFEIDSDDKPDVTASTSSDNESTGMAKRKVSPPSPAETQTAASQHMEIDDDDDQEFDTLKRKLLAAEEEDGNVVSSSPVVKRKYELLLGQMLVCFNQSENCLRFVKDYAHAFQHLPPNPVLNQALSPRNFELFVEHYGGPLELLKKVTDKYNAKLTVPSRITLKDEKKLVFIRIKFESLANLQQTLLNVHSFAGTGEDFTSAENDAALKALKFLRETLFTDNKNNNNVSFPI